MLATGCVRHVEFTHGETFLILDGNGAGTSFNGVRLVEPDSILSTGLDEDPRARITLEIDQRHNIQLSASQRLQTADGRIWTAVKQPQAKYLTDTYELTEIVSTLDT